MNLSKARSISPSLPLPPSTAELLAIIVNNRRYGQCIKIKIQRSFVSRSELAGSFRTISRSVLSRSFSTAVTRDRALLIYSRKVIVFAKKVLLITYYCDNIVIKYSSGVAQKVI